MNRHYEKIIQKYKNVFTVYTSEKDTVLTIEDNSNVKYVATSGQIFNRHLDIIIGDRKFTRKFDSIGQLYKVLDGLLSKKMSLELQEDNENPFRQKLFIKDIYKAMYKNRRIPVLLFSILLLVLLVPLMLTGIRLVAERAPHFPSDRYIYMLCNELLPMPTALFGVLLGLKGIIDVIRIKNISFAEKTIECLSFIMISFAITMILVGIVDEGTPNVDGKGLFILGGFLIVSGLFLYFLKIMTSRRYSGENTKEFNRTPILPDIETTKLLMDKAKDMAEHTINVMSVSLTEGQNTSPIDSKLYGVPYWPYDKIDDIPHSLVTQGRVYLLAQLNLSDLNIGKEGILQVYNVNGNGESWYEVFYHKDVDISKQMDRQDLANAGIGSALEEIRAQGLKINFEERVDNIYCYETNTAEFMQRVAQALGIHIDDLLSYTHLIKLRLDNEEPSIVNIGHTVGTKPTDINGEIDIAYINTNDADSIIGQEREYDSLLKISLSVEDFESNRFENCKVHKISPFNVYYR